MKLFGKSAPKTQRKSFIDYITSANITTLSATSSYSAYASEGYVKNPVVFRCVNRKASTAKLLEPKLFRYSKDGQKKEEIKTHPILDLLYQPNPTMSWADLVEAMFVDRNIGGEAFLILTKKGEKPLEIWAVQPSQVENIEYNKSTDSFTYTIGGVKYFARGSEGYKSEVLHWKTRNPLNALRGLSPMAPAGSSITAFNEALKWNNALINNGANPSGALRTDSALTDEQFNRLKQDLEVSYSGAKNAGKPILLENGLDWKEMSLSPKDMDYNQGVLSSARFICTAYGVPSQLVGITGDSTYSNYEQALLSFLQDTLAPEALDFILALNRWLLDWYPQDKNLWLEVSYDNIDGLEPRKKEKTERICKEAENGLCTINEGRTALGKDTIPEGDVTLINSGKIPLDMAGNDILNGAQNELNAGIEEIAGARPKPKS
jgi:HK97 family phage portal protein